MECFDVSAPRVKGVKPHPDARCKACEAVVKNAQPSNNMLRHVLNCDRVDADAKAHWV